MVQNALESLPNDLAEQSTLQFEQQKWIDDIPGGSLIELSLQQHSREHHFRNYLNLQGYAKI